MAAAPENPVPLLYNLSEPVKNTNGYVINIASPFKT